MSVETEDNTEQYAGNGVTTVFSFPQYFQEEGDLKVYTTVNSTGVATLKTITTHYTVEDEGDPDGGTVTFLVAPATGITVTIINDPPKTQDKDFTENDKLPVEQVEEALDKLTMIAQQLDTRLDSAMVKPFGFVGTFSNTLPGDLAGAINKLPMTNDAGTGWADAADWPTGDEVSAAQGYAVAAEAARDAAVIAKTAAELAETNAETAEANAETAETNAETAETNAEAAQAAAETARDAAIAAQTAAETAETNAETAETNAETAQAAAEAAAAAAALLPVVYKAIVGSATGCTHATLTAALADAGVVAGSRILVTEDQTLNATISVAKANLQIEFMPGVTFTKGSAGTAFDVDANGVRFKGGRFSGFTTTVFNLKTGRNYLFITECRFATCTEEWVSVDASPVVATAANMPE